MTPTATLKNWEIVRAGKNLYAKGRIFGDSKKRYEDGEVIITSPIVEGGGGFLTTFNSIYKLEN